MASISRALAELKTAQQKGDFAGIGKAQSDLATAIQQFEAAQKAAKPSTSPTPSPSAKK